MRVKLNLQQLAAFAQVAQTLSFRAAAEHLHVSQPALSRTIRLAEETLGAPLFDRTTRHVELSAAGRELLPIARRILYEFDDAFSELAQFLEGRSGHITVAALPSVSVGILPRAIAAFRDTHPTVTFSLTEAAAQPLLEKIADGSVDFGISVQPPVDGRFRYTHLLDDAFVLICRRDDPLAGQSVAHWSVFTERPYLASSERSSIRPLIDAALARRNIDVTPKLFYPSIAAAGALVAAGLGITAVPRLALSALDSRDLAIVPLHRSRLSRRIGIITRHGRSLSKVCQSFMDTITAQVAGDGRRRAEAGAQAPVPPGT